MHKTKKSGSSLSLPYSLSKKYKKPQKPEEGEVWIANPQSLGTIKYDKFLDLVAHGDKNTRARLSGDLQLVATELRNSLRMGYCVDLKDLGMFFYTFKCDPWEGNEQDFKPNAHIKQVRTVWRASSKLKDLKKHNTYDDSDEISFKKVPLRTLMKEAVARSKTLPE